MYDNVHHDNDDGIVELFTQCWTEYDTPIIPRDYVEMILLLSLADRFGVGEGR